MFPSRVNLYNSEQQIGSCGLFWSKSVVTSRSGLTVLLLFAPVLTEPVDGEKDSFSVVMPGGVSGTSLIYSWPLP